MVVEEQNSSGLRWLALKGTSSLMSQAVAEMKALI